MDVRTEEDARNVCSLVRKQAVIYQRKDGLSMGDAQKRAIGDIGPENYSQAMSINARKSSGNSRKRIVRKNNHNHHNDDVKAVLKKEKNTVVMRDYRNLAWKGYVMSDERMVLVFNNQCDKGYIKSCRSALITEGFVFTELTAEPFGFWVKNNKREELKKEFVGLRLRTEELKKEFVELRLRTEELTKESVELRLKMEWIEGELGKR